MSDFEIVIANFEKPDHDFEKLAKRASEAGMTHVLITQETPLAKWQDDYPEWTQKETDGDLGGRKTTGNQPYNGQQGMESNNKDSGVSTPSPSTEVFKYDPYPSWYNRKVGLLKVLPPEPLQSHVSDEWAAWADKVTEMLDHRCQILRKHDLKGVYATNEPQVLPEEVFTEHPQWRGPRVDHPNRARKPHFTPCVDHPEVQELYHEAVANLLRRYPEIDLFQFVTTDAGSGFCWAESLYPGKNGNSYCRDRSMTDRVTDFFAALEAGAETADTSIEYNLVEIPPQEWMLPTFENDERIASNLNSGQAINNLEGPNVTRFQTDAGISHWEGSILYPVKGIPQPVECARTLQSVLYDPVMKTGNTSSDKDSDNSGRNTPPRLKFGCPPGIEDLHLEVYERVMAEEPCDQAETLQILKSLAVDQVGKDHADTLLSLWSAIDEATTVGQTIPDHPPTMVGGVHQRWITRPFVPFPEELDSTEKRYYRNYLFQARSEEQAEDLVDCQGMRLYKGWSARLLMTFVFDRLDSKIERAEQLATELAANLDGDLATRYQDLVKRLQILSCLHNNSRNAINYQAIRDYIRERDAVPEKNPVLGTHSNWERDFMLRTAREEIDNSVRLIELLQDTDKDIIYQADSLKEEDIRILGPNLVEEIKRKVEIMNDRWTDYRRLFTQPNP